MATSQMELLYGLPEFDPWQTFDRVLDTSVTQTASDTEIVVPAGFGGGQVVFKGTFTVVSGVVTAGTMTGFEVFANDTKVLVGSKYATDAVDLSAAITDYQMGDGQPLFDLISEVPIKLLGSDQDDHIRGNSSEYKVVGRDGNDILEGDLGAGTLKGGKGNDLLFASKGLETMSGGKGADVFLFGGLDPISPFDKIKDFAFGEDMIGLSPDEAHDLLPGFLLADQFHKGTSATTADQRIIYDKSSGKLYFDLDGTGSEAQFQFAKLAAGTKLNVSSFIVEEFFPV